MNDTSQNKLINSYGKENSRAAPSSGPERNQLEIMPFVIYCGILEQEPLWFKLIWIIFPCVGISSYSPCIDENLGSRNDIVSTYLYIFRGTSKGTGGCRRRVSFKTAFSFFMEIGCRMSSLIAHSKTVYVVSVPAANMSCTQRYL
ncbi:hypothetical protein G4B88_013383 [Cannabis sativa]|uniref:Uncharacterized protein n=1 Tax=Cannabis sativa TaxID=3483 RepID=A0A7J6FJ22_CANSA|nr:hypothetical protein G4B88_013383 [Cannabis sativa]